MAPAQAGAIRPPQDTRVIAVERDGPVARLWIDRGGARNAFPVAGWRALADACGTLADSDVAAVILASRDSRAFTAGADIRGFSAMRGDAEAAETFLIAMRAALDALWGLPMPVIAAVDGGCYGAGVALAIAADVIVAGDHAVFATTPAKLGLLYPQEDIDRLIARIGPGAAAQMLLTGELVNADAAMAIRLADVRADAALARAETLAAAIASNAHGAVRGLKAQLRGRLPDPRAAFLARFDSEELAERLERFG